VFDDLTSSDGEPLATRGVDESEVVGEVAGGLVDGQAGQVVAQADALVERGEVPEFEPPPQGGLAEQEQLDRRLVGAIIAACSTWLLRAAPRSTPGS
jgi:hypothetical protein